MRKLILLFVITLPLPTFATTKVRLHFPASTVSGYQTMSLNLGPVGAAVKTSVTNTTAGGTSIQATQTGGGTALAWMSEPFAASITLSGTETCNVYAKEAATANNATFQCQLFKYSGGVLGSVFCTATLSTELTTSIATGAATCTATATTFSIGDQLVLKIFVVNCATNGCPSGTMGAGTPGVTIDYDGHTAATDGDTNVVLAENVTFNPYGGSGGNPAVVQVAMNSNNNSAGPGTNCTTPDNCYSSGDFFLANFGNLTQAGNMITVQYASDPQATLPTITDNKSNTYYLGGLCHDATNNEDVVLWYAPNIAAGTTQVKVLWNANSADSIAPDIAEWTNVATAAPVDGSTCNTGTVTSVTAGSTTPNYTGDLVLQVAWNDTIAFGSMVGVHYTAGSQSNITWAKFSDGQFSAFGSQWGVYSSTAALNPTFTTSTAGFDSVAVFFRSSASGSQSSAMRVIAQQNVPIAASGGIYNISPFTTYFPCPTAADLITADFAGPSHLTDLTAVADSNSNTWTSNHAQVCDTNDVACVHTYRAQNASISPNEWVKLTFNTTSNDSVFLYCIEGAATAPFDSSGSTTNTGNQGTAGDLTVLTVTPSTSNGLVVTTLSQANNTTLNWTNTAFGFVGCFYSNEPLSANGCGANNGWGMYSNPNTSTETWTAHEASGTLAIGSWAAQADVYKAPAGTVGTMPPSVY